MRRWRCPDCGAVHTARPSEYGLGIQHPKALQQESLKAKLAGRPFLPGLSRQVQQHWKKVFTEVCQREGNWTPAKRAMEQAVAIGETGLTKRRIHRASLPHAEHPYLPFALTVGRPVFSLE